MPSRDHAVTGGPRPIQSHTMHGDEHSNDLWRWVGPCVRQVSLRNYRSLAACDITLHPLTAVVGHNGAGKGNLLDALAFVAQAVGTSLTEALARRGGLEALRRRSTGHPRNVACELEVRLPTWHLASYGFELMAHPEGGAAVRTERMVIRDPNDQLVAHIQRSHDAITRSSLGALPPPVPDRLHLPHLAGLGHPGPEGALLEALHKTLRGLVVYRFDPELLRRPAVPAHGERLAADGSNLPSVLHRLERRGQGEALTQVRAALGAITPGLLSPERVPLGTRETVQVRQPMAGAQHPWKFQAAELSDGTLRALAMLVAAWQNSTRTGPVALVGLRQPETDLHPTALGPLLDALRSASRHTQVLFTTHSPDLLDHLQPGADGLLVAHHQGGITQIDRADDASRRLLREGQATAGALLRRDRLRPAAAPPPAADHQLTLFSPEGG